MDMISYQQFEQVDEIIRQQNLSVPLVAVYCGSRMGHNPIYAKTAFELGVALAKAGFGVVYGGASIGIMGAVADGVLSQNGVVVGVMPKLILDERKEVSHLKLTKLHLTDNMHTRKTVMASYASAFIALSGGFGTLEEITEMLTWRQLNQHKKPLMVLNTNRFYEHFLAHIEHMVTEGFMSQSDANTLQCFESVDELIVDLTDKFKA